MPLDCCTKGDGFPETGEGGPHGSQPRKLKLRHRIPSNGVIGPFICQSTALKADRLGKAPGTSRGFPSPSQYNLESRDVGLKEQKLGFFAPMILQSMAPLRLCTYLRHLSNSEIRTGTRTFSDTKIWHSFSIDLNERICEFEKCFGCRYREVEARVFASLEKAHHSSMCMYCIRN